jgi:membrane fusion protein, multidrug efflux system
VEIAVVKSTTLRETAEYLATLRSRRSVRVQPQVEGWVTDIPVASGARVRRGALLMRIDSRVQVAEVRAQAAARVARQADLAYWQQQYRRLLVLQRGGGASRQEVDQARSALASAEATLAAQEQQVRGAEVGLRYYNVTASETGTVGDIPVRVGDLVTPQTLLTTIDHNEVLEAYVNIPVEQVPRARMGQPVEILTLAGGPPLASEVTFIAPQVANEQTVLVKTRVDNGTGQLRNSQLVRARVIWSERQGPAVPVLAVQMLNGQNFVWTVKDAPGGRLVAEQRAVQVGPLVDQVYPVLKGLQPGDRVVIGGMQKLRPGAAVAPAGAAARDGGPA